MEDSYFDGLGFVICGTGGFLNRLFEPTNLRHLIFLFMRNHALEEAHGIKLPYSVVIWPNFTFDWLRRIWLCGVAQGCLLVSLDGLNAVSNNNGKVSLVFDSIKETLVFALWCLKL